MIFETAVQRARLIYAVMMASCTCFIMSAVSTSILTPMESFWRHWPKVLGIDLLIAIPVAIMLGPIVRKLCTKLYPELVK